MSKPLYGFNWVLTNAQIELLAMDVSIVVTDRGKKEIRGQKKEFGTPSAHEINEAARRWKEKYADGNTIININDYK